MSKPHLIVLAALALTACASGDHPAGEPPASVATAAAPSDPWLRPAAVPYPPDNAPTESRVDLGRDLFFDPRLSGSAMMSCATCHNPSLGWTDGQATAVGEGAKHLARKTPTIVNTAYIPLQMWDGRLKTLEDQALVPIKATGIMNLPLDKMVVNLKAIPGYAPLFEQAYPNEGISAATVSKAIASYERTIVSTTSPFDRWRMGDSHAISDSAKRGFETFNGKARCALCHQGFNFTDNGFHNIGVSSLGAKEDDGRFPHRKLAVLKGAFKTPTLRDVELSGPYMHNGMYKTLEDVVDHYDRGGDAKANLSPNIQPLGLTPQEKRDLVAFMKSLTGEPMVVVVPHLPPG